MQRQTNDCGYIILIRSRQLQARGKKMSDKPKEDQSDEKERVEKKKSASDEDVSLHPLTFEEAVRKLAKVKPPEKSPPAKD